MRDPTQRGRGTEAWWPAALEASGNDLSSSRPDDEQSLEILARRRDPKKVARAALAAAKSAFANPDYAHFRRNFLMAWEMVRGRQYPANLFVEASSWRVRVTRNKLFGATKQIESLLMDMMPEGFLVPEQGAMDKQDLEEAMRRLGVAPAGMDRLPSRPSAREQLSRITEVMQAEHEHRDDHLHLGNLIADLVVGGMGVEKIFWNDDERVVDAKQLYPLDVAFDPDCRSKLRRGCKFLAIRHKVDLEDVLERFDPPKRVIQQLIGSASSYYDGLFSEQDMPIKEVYSALEYPSGHGRELVSGELRRDKVEFYEVYYLGERSFSAQHSVVPTGELSSGRVVCVSENVDEPLYDGPNPDPKGECPLVFYDNYGFGHSPYPFGEVEPNLGNQIALNIIMSAAAMTSVLNQNAQWITEEGVLVGDEGLSNRPGAIFELATNKIGRIQRLPGVEIPASMFQLMERLDKNIMDVLNVNDMTMGGQPQTHTPAYAMQMAQTMNLASLRRKAGYLAASWRRRTRLEANLYIAYAALLKSRGDLHSDLGEYARLGENLEDLRFDVKVVTKSERPVGFVAEMQFALEAFDKRLIDRLGVVHSVSGYPIDPELQKLFEKEREAALLQADINLATLRAQHAQMGLQGAAQSSGPMAPTVSAGMQPAAPEQVAMPTQAPIQLPMNPSVAQ